MRVQECMAATHNVTAYCDTCRFVPYCRYEHRRSSHEDPPSVRCTATGVSAHWRRHVRARLSARKSRFTFAHARWNKIVIRRAERSLPSPHQIENESNNQQPGDDSECDGDPTRDRRRRSGQPARENTCGGGQTQREATPCTANHFLK